MLNIEKFLLLTVPYRSRLHEVNSLFVTARTALTLLEFQRTSTIALVPADATKSWDMANPRIDVNEYRTPDAVGLNDAFKNIDKFHNKQVSAAIGNKKLDPIKGLEAEFARQGILTGDAKHGYELVATDALEEVKMISGWRFAVNGLSRSRIESYWKLLRRSMPANSSSAPSNRSGRCASSAIMYTKTHRVIPSWPSWSKRHRL